MGEEGERIEYQQGYDHRNAKMETSLSGERCCCCAAIDLLLVVNFVSWQQLRGFENTAGHGC